MARSEAFSPIHDIEEHGSEQYENPPREPAAWWRILKKTLLITVVAVFGFLVVSVENTAKFLVELTGPLVAWGGHPRDEQPAQLAASVPTSGESSSAKNEAAGERAESKPIEPNSEEVQQPSTELLFRQFQAWAARDAQRTEALQSNEVPPAAQPGQNPVANEPVNTGSVKKNRHVQRSLDGQAQAITRDPKKESQQPQGARARVAPSRDTERRSLAAKSGGT